MEGSWVGDFGPDLSGSCLGRVMTSYCYRNELPRSPHLGEIHDCLCNWSVLNGVSYCVQTSRLVTAPKVLFRMIFLYYRHSKATRSSGM